MQIYDIYHVSDDSWIKHPCAVCKLLSCMWQYCQYLSTQNILVGGINEKERE